MKSTQLTAVLFATALGTGAAVAQNQMPVEDQPMTIGGIETVCTGSGLDARADPQWRAYPFHLEVAGKSGQYLGDEQVSVTGNGQSVSVHCVGPWVLMKLPAGSYKVSLDVPEGGHRDLTVKVPGRIVVHFPNAGGAEAPNGRVASK